MNTLAKLSLVVAATALSACGGGGSDSSTTPPGVQTYGFEPLPEGSQAFYDQTFIDNANNAIQLPLRKTYSAVNGDGSFTLVSDESSTVLVVNGTSYGGHEIVEIRDADGHVLTRRTSNNRSSVACSFTPAELLVPYPIYVGQTWSSDWTANCSDGRVVTSSLRNGVVLGLETITVPAGTFETLHLSYTVTISNTSTPVVESIVEDVWRTQQQGLLVQFRSTDSYSGAVPSSGYVVAASGQLMSVQAGRN